MQPKQDDDAIELSIVMPCLDEAETLGTCIGKALGFLSNFDVRGEVVIADNGSTDGSQAIAKAAGARVVHVRARGYGSALKGGIEEARGRYVIMGDADDSYDFENLMPFLEKLRSGCDLVMGNRFKGGVLPGAMPPLHRYLGNPVLTAIGRLFFRCPSKDFHCGLRGFSKHAAARMNLQTSGMEFASEMVIKATLLEMKIAEVPTTLSPDGRSRPPHLRSWRDGWRHLRFMLLFSPNWLFLYPGVLLLLVGLLVGARLAFEPIAVGGVNFDVQSLLFMSAAVIVGFQSVVFAVFTKVFAFTEGLLPSGSRIVRWTNIVSLEAGLVLGLVLLMAGLSGTAYSLVYWADSSFGSLDTSITLRFVVPSVTAIVLGFQVILSSFFLSILGLGRASQTVTADASTGKEFASSVRLQPTG